MVTSIMVSSDIADAHKRVDNKDEVTLSLEGMMEKSNMFFGKFIWT